MPYIDACQFALGCLLAVAAWAAPQPQYSQGRLYGYGGDALVAANAEYHGYSLDGYAGGGAAISPAMLGRIMWARAEGGAWVGPLLVVDAVARRDAYDSIFERREIAELPRSVMAQLGFAYGGPGYVFFGVCPPPADSLHYTPQPYAPELRLESADSPGRSFWPYPEQERPMVCWP